MAATTRNVFIANLALADLLLCLFTIPLTLIDLVNKHWGLAPGMVMAEYNDVFRLSGITEYCQFGKYHASAAVSKQL